VHLDQGHVGDEREFHAEVIVDEDVAPPRDGSPRDLGCEAAHLKSHTLGGLAQHREVSDDRVDGVAVGLQRLRAEPARVLAQWEPGVACRCAGRTERAFLASRERAERSNIDAVS